MTDFSLCRSRLQSANSARKELELSAARVEMGAREHRQRTAEVTVRREKLEAECSVQTESLAALRKTVREQISDQKAFVTEFEEGFKALKGSLDREIAYSSTLRSWLEQANLIEEKQSRRSSAPQTRVQMQHTIGTRALRRSSQFLL